MYRNYIVAARTAQGYDEWHRSSREERVNVVKNWHTLQIELAKEKQHIRHGSLHGPQNYIKTHHLNHKESQRIAAEKNQTKPPRRNSKQSPLVQTTSSDKGEFEEAIQASIAATSQGNPDEDRVIEQAIRASIRELQADGKDGDDSDALQRAIQASVAEAARARGSSSDDGADQDRSLTDALHRSLTQEEPHPLVHTNFDDSGVDTDDDENIKAAIRYSTAPTANDASESSDLEKAMKHSKEDYEEHTRQLSKAKTEEDIVLDYVKRQSLLEDQLKTS